MPDSDNHRQEMHLNGPVGLRFFYSLNVLLFVRNGGWTIAVAL